MSLIREATLDDVPELDRIRRAIFAWWVPSVKSQQKSFAYNPPQARAQRLVAEVDGVLAGFAWSGFNTTTSEEGAGSANVIVDPAYSGRGVGTELYQRVEAHLREIGVRRAHAYTVGEPRNLAWVARFGWETGHSARFSALDPRELPPMPAIAEGVTLANLGTLTAEQAFELDKAMADEPGDVPNDWSFEEFKNRLWDDPDLDFELSTVALVDGEPACFTNIQANHETGRCWSGGTGTHQKFRGRGLAKLVKSAALRKAASAGVTQALTANDYSNGPMLAVNDWLGYKVIASEYSVLKTFG